MSKQQNKALAKDIYNWCIKYNLWQDCIIYFNGKAWSTIKEWNGVCGTKIDNGLYEYENKNPCDYFEYGNPDTVSMSFEGTLYHVINYYYDFHGYEGKSYTKLYEQFGKLFEKHGFYYELGHAWNLSAYEL